MLKQSSEQLPSSGSGLLVSLCTGSTLTKTHLSPCAPFESYWVAACTKHQERRHHNNLCQNIANLCFGRPSETTSQNSDKSEKSGVPLPCSSLIQKVLLEILQYHYTIQHWLFRSPAVRLAATFCQTTKKSWKEIKYLRIKKTRNLIQENKLLTNNVTISATNCLKLSLLKRAQGAGVWRGECMSLSRMNGSFWLLSILPVSALHDNND